MRGSLRRRLSFFYGGLLTVALLLFCTVVYAVFRTRLYGQVDAQLRAEGAGAMNLLLEEFYEVDDDDDDDDEEAAGPGGPHGFEGIDLVEPETHFQLIDPEGVTLQLSPGLQGQLLVTDPTHLPPDPELTTVVHPTLGRLRQYILPARVGPETYWVAAGKSLAEVDAALRQLLVLFAVFLPGTLAFVGLGGYLLAGRALTPIERVIGAARAIREGDLSRRIGLDGPDDELKALADEFDEMIASLEALVAAERRFVADASHELRTPLAVIDSCAQVNLREREPTEGQLREALTVVRRETRSMTRLADDLLTLARADAGEEQLHLESVSLAPLVEEVRDAVQWVTNGHTPQVDVPDGLTVWADRRRLGQLLRNLLDNAFRHCPATGSTTVSARAEGRWVHIEVSDDGPGIAAEHLPHLFERFYRVDKGRSREHGGVGLGLAICRWIAEAHGGRIEVESAVGEGTTFAVTLPAEPCS